MQFIDVLKIQRCKDSVHGGRMAYFASYGVQIVINLEGLLNETAESINLIGRHYVHCIRKPQGTL